MGLIWRNYIGNTNMELRGRTGWNGLQGVHPTQSSYQINNLFVGFRVDPTATTLNGYSNAFLGQQVDWFGCAGAQVTKPGAHNDGNAIDITRVQFTGNVHCDMNSSWRSSASLSEQRKYVAIHATARREMGVVLTAWWRGSNGDTSHQNHMHWDSWAQQAGPISTGSESDTILVRSAANTLDGYSLPLVQVPWDDGAYQSLLGKFNMKCLDPKTNSSHARVFCDYIAWHGLADRAAGHYQYAHC